MLLHTCGSGDGPDLAFVTRVPENLPQSAPDLPSAALQEGPYAALDQASIKQEEADKLSPLPPLTTAPVLPTKDATLAIMAKTSSLAASGNDTKRKRQWGAGESRRAEMPAAKDRKENNRHADLTRRNFALPLAA